ncbi:MAG: 3-deoxy-D-manno-octulosonic acid kinase [Pseudomonadota bacterium]
MKVSRLVMPLRLFRTETGAILYDPSRIDHPAEAYFDAAALERAGRVRATRGGRGSAWFVAMPGAGGGSEWVLRHCRRGGFVARWVQDSYLWLGEDRVRSFAELRLLAHFENLDLPAARPVAALYRRVGLAYRADLLTLAIPGARPLSALLGPDLPLSTWCAVGACIRRFHDAGAHHADLNAHNVLVDAADRVHIVDFDRGALRRDGAWKAANLARLERSLLKLSRESPGLYRAEQWAALLEGYR